MKSDYFEGELTALNSVVGVCKHNPGKSGAELEVIFREMIDDLRGVIGEKEWLNSYCEIDKNVLEDK